MKKEKKVWAITLIALWWLAPCKTNAQQNQDSVRVLHEFVVTATKFPKSQSETGKVLNVIDEEQLQRSSGKDVAQLLNEQVGLVINGAGSNPGKDKSVFLRGAAGPYTLILLDGIPLNDPSGFGGAYDLRMLPIDQITRIEILKGSQSTLYGTDAIAGVINIITKKKGDKPVSGFGTLTYGSYNTYKANAGVAGNTKFIDYNASYTRLQTDGVSEAKDTTGNNNFDKDGYKQNSLQFNLGIKPIQQLYIRPFLNYTDYDGKYDGGGFMDDTTNVYKTSLLNYGVSGQYTLSKGAINFQYGRNDTWRKFKSAYGESRSMGNYDNAEIFINHDVGRNFQVVAGVNYQYLNMEDGNAVEKDTSATITSTYASFFIKNFNGFSFELGGRYNHHSEFGDALTYSINPSYLINRQIKIFANYSTGFKAPTLSELYGPYGANNKLQPQESKNAEAGAQLFTLNRKFDIRATVFSRKIDNVIIYGSAGYINLDKQNDHGFEIEPNFNVNNKVSISTFYAFVDGYVKTKTYSDEDTTYNNLIRRPKHSFGINCSYQVNNNFFVSFNLKSFGMRKDFSFNQNKSVDLSAYQLLNIYAEYKFINGRLKFFIDAKNVLNQDYTEVYGYNSLRFNLSTGVSFKI